MLKRPQPKLKSRAKCICLLVVIAALLGQYVFWVVSSSKPSLLSTRFMSPAHNEPGALQQHRHDPVPIDDGPPLELGQKDVPSAGREEQGQQQEQQQEQQQKKEQEKKANADEDPSAEEVPTFDDDEEEELLAPIGAIPRWVLSNEPQIPGCQTADSALAPDGTPCVNLTRAMVGQLIYTTETDKVQYLYCAIPKNGCTYHLAMQNRIYGEDDYERPYVIHSKRAKSYKSMYKRNTTTIASMLHNATLPKYLVVRNPLRRTLSAYLDKVQSVMPKDQWTAEAFHQWLYKEFPESGPPFGNWRRVNPHWRPQLFFCGYKIRNIHSYFKVFRVEEPEEYVDFMYKIIPDEFLRDGWGKGRNISFSDHVLGPRRRTGNTDEKFLMYYNKLEVFDHMVKILQEDIRELRYVDEINSLRESVRRKNRVE